MGFGSIFALKAPGGSPTDQWGAFTRLVFGGGFPVGFLLVLLAGGELYIYRRLYVHDGSVGRVSGSRGRSY
jgi:formate/nitrite transporter FocA (FNT family)